MSQNNDPIYELIKLQNLSKFDRDDALSYSGITDAEVKSEATNTLNQSISKFIALIQHSDSSNKRFLLTIKNVLESFDRNSLDTEDRERVCLYIEQIMDIIGLESSEGILNKWMYGFDPMET